MDTAYSVSFKIPRRNIALSKSLNADPRILLGTREAKWISFELQSGDDLAGAIRWFARASRLAEKARKSS